MTGSTLKRGSTWTAYWFTADSATGKRRQHSKGGFLTKKAAGEHLNTVLGDVQAGSWAPDSKLTMKQLLADWLAAKSSQGLRPATLSQYRNVIDAWLVPHIGEIELRRFGPAEAQALVSTLRTAGSRLNRGGLSDRSVQLAVTVLKAATGWAVETGLVMRDPLVGFRRPRVKSGAAAGSAWTADEARAFLRAVSGDRLTAAWSLFLTCGLRRGELCGLRWEAVDLTGNSLRILTTLVLVDGRPVQSEPKTASGRRSIPLDEALVKALRSHRASQAAERLMVGEAWRESGYVFTDELGAPLHPESVSTRFETLADRAGIRRVRLHDLRHTAASLMLAAGENVKVVAELLGHSSPTITQDIYQHVMPGMAEGAVERNSALLLG